MLLLPGAWRVGLVRWAEVAALFLFARALAVFLLDFIFLFTTSPYSAKFSLRSSSTLPHPAPERQLLVSLSSSHDIRRLSLAVMRREEERASLPLQPHALRVASRSLCSIKDNFSQFKYICSIKVIFRPQEILSSLHFMVGLSSVGWSLTSTSDLLENAFLVSPQPTPSQEHCMQCREVPLHDSLLRALQGLASLVANSVLLPPLHAFTLRLTVSLNQQLLQCSSWKDRMSTISGSISHSEL